MSRNIMPTASVHPKQPCKATNQIDSPYASNLHTNYTPTESEIPQIKEFLTDPLKRLSSLDAEIERVQSILDELRHERCALSDEIEAHRALISPIRRIPFDVLGEIFVHCLPDGRNAVMSSREAPILLGRICSAWRSIALSTPRLWASLHIPTPMEISETGQVLAQPEPTFIAKMERRCEGAREWIGRSRESPISISICIPTHVYSYELQPSSMKTFEVAVAQILASSHRWRKVDFRATKDSFTRLQQLAEDAVPLLESLVIAGGSLRAWDPLASDSSGRWTKFSGLLSARKLRKLSLSYLKEDLLSLPVRWSQLTHLNLDLDIPAKFGRTSRGLRYSDIIKVLRRCPLLVSCGLSLESTAFDVLLQPDHELPLAEYTLTLPLLENLLLNLSGRWDECHLKHLDLPRLRHFEIKFQETFSGSQASRPSWVPFLSRNGNSVKQLIIDIPSLTRDELIGFLESVPLLIHLHVSSASSSSSVVDPEVIDRLTGTPSAENPDCLCPLLEELQCNGTHCASFSESQLLSLVQKRSDTEKGGLLKRVDVTFHDRREPKNFDKFLDSLIGSGMKVSQRNQSGTSRQAPSFTLNRTTSSYLLL
ncbi:uncharacterized protein LACBIDRAFT_304790 [Laccaria bicolor S238N-H82]|uniref:Predicted protein n=1 Tax=Laccaria bicolor (strain S238N-H82 / ATCC MYA-4686) TaxID=486041 RepID=B0DMC3_LACBS|nr:uncharacterized protein LACBIDRAFT_304790 [Laccaria bicolor S238N-H82]EDR04257.1 predicted protein [Laccaria bicolor S238N-H82]|eukprot:XP_001885148.1 predicted protein [Laccaria bicolor S238N-H82]